MNVNGGNRKEDGWSSEMLRDAINFSFLSRYLMKFLQKSGCWKTPVFCEGVIT
ncbi:hypothetical protein NDS46_07085 [Paenibacillus thiaminolyticus]|uniref:hypothetical protein n=1 Tax=Paenibacillus thiaminolyticus TaxID=49283 RepID=UPI00232FB6F1|nr:hypothetical protein [Paenibacillus thiaminolyticus]WCF09631.1 hypothetical protein NDS46_07085 [Paenibacillus thiaminolyticus]